MIWGFLAVSVQISSSYTSVEISHRLKSTHSFSSQSSEFLVYIPVSAMKIQNSLSVAGFFGVASSHTIFTQLTSGGTT